MNRVREVRLQMGLAQQALAVRARISPGVLTMIERYGYCPGPDMRQRIAEVLGVTKEELFPSGQKNGTTES
ncbi:helix-turn-helix transcriptional regulator [Chloroflexota bacterium]